MKLLSVVTPLSIITNHGRLVGHAVAIKSLHLLNILCLTCQIYLTHTYFPTPLVPFSWNTIVVSLCLLPLINYILCVVHAKPTPNSYFKGYGTNRGNHSSNNKFSLVVLLNFLIVVYFTLAVPRYLIQY